MPHPRSHQYAGILRAVTSAAWAMQPEKLEAILDLLALRAGGNITPAEIRQAYAAERAEQRSRLAAYQAAGAGGTPGGQVAVLSLYGTIAQRATLMSEYSGGTSCESFGARFQAAVASADVSAIVLDVDSPGGTIEGVQELAARIHSARGEKRIVAVANSLMASAAYWIASAADEIVASPSSTVGSIGVFTVHTSTAGMDAQLGLERTLIRAGRFKAEDMPFTPLSDDARAARQAMVDEVYDDFVGAVARHRGVSAAAVRSGYGEGRALLARQALEAGMVDRIATLDEVLAELTGGRGAATAGGRARAHAPRPIAALRAAADDDLPDPADDDDETHAEDGATCPDCGAALLDDADACPECDAPRAEERDEDDEHAEEPDDEDLEASDDDEDLEASDDDDELEASDEDDDELEATDDEEDLEAADEHDDEEHAEDGVTCPDCGTALPDDADACPDCGAPRAEQEEQDDEQDDDTTAPSARGGAGWASPLPPHLPARRAMEPTVPRSAAGRPRRPTDSPKPPRAAGGNTNTAAAAPTDAQRIAAFAAEHGMESRVGEWVLEGRTFAQVRTEVLAQYSNRAQATGAVRVGANREAGRPWASFGEQLLAVRNAHPQVGGTVDPRLFAGPSGVNQSTPSEGGFLVGGTFAQQIWEGLSQQPDDLLSLTDQYTVEGAFTEFNANDEKSRKNGSRFGGVQGYWLAEADQLTKSRPKFRRMRLEPHTMGVLVYITERFDMNSSISLEQYVSRAASEEISFMTGASIFDGNGVGKPMGFTKSGAKITVAKEAGQPAATIVPKNISKMWSRLHPRSRANAVWLHNIDIEPQLDVLSHLVENKAGSENVGGFEGRLYNPEKNTLKGRPLVACEFAETLGTEGDLVLVDLGAYATGTRGAIREAASIHVRFEYAENAFRFLYDVDGQNWLNQPLEPYKGSQTLSNIVTLATRA